MLRSDSWLEPEKAELLVALTAALRVVGMEIAAAVASWARISEVTRVEHLAASSAADQVDRMAAAMVEWLARALAARMGRRTAAQLDT